jgi:hypothetical protein
MLEIGETGDRIAAQVGLDAREQALEPLLAQPEVLRRVAERDADRMHGSPRVDAVEHAPPLADQLLPISAHARVVRDVIGQAAEGVDRVQRAALGPGEHPEARRGSLTCCARISA